MALLILHDQSSRCRSISLGQVTICLVTINPPPASRGNDGRTDFLFHIAISTPPWPTRQQRKRSTSTERIHRCEEQGVPIALVTVLKKCLATVALRPLQFLVEKVIRARIYDSGYWKEHCFALTGMSGRPQTENFPSPTDVLALPSPQPNLSSTKR